MNDRDPLLDRLATLDPVRVDRAPEPGSDRHAEILERAMQTTPTVADPSDPGPSIPPGATRARGAAAPRRRRRALLAGAVAAVVLIVGGFLLVEPDRTLTPASALTQAAENTGDELTMRARYVRDDGNGGFSVVRSEYRGDDVRRAYSTIEPDGTIRRNVERDEYVVFIGDQGWTQTGGPQTVRREERNAPYAESSAAIVEAAVRPSIVTKIGTEAVRGVDTTHYRIKLDAAAIRRLQQLPANQLSGFELEDPSEVRSLDVWIADGHIRQIRVTQNFEAPGSPGTTVEFYDFGADITITPPR